MTAVAAPTAAVDPLAPPHNLDAERVVLGSMMLSPAMASELSGVLSSGDFYKPTHGAIFTVICRLAEAGEPTDMVAVLSALMDAGDAARVGGGPYLHDCVAAVPAVVQAPWYAARVADAAQRRRIADAGVLLQRLARQDADLPAVVDAAQRAVHEATSGVGAADEQPTVGDHVVEVMERLEAVARGDVPPGIPTGLSDYDQLTGGHTPGQLIIIGARPGIGKSILLGGWLRAAVERTMRPAVLFSVEMTVREMMHRLLADVAAVPLARFKTGLFLAEERRRLAEATDRIAAWPLAFVDSCRTVPAMKAYTRRFASRHGDLACIGVDYLQRITQHERQETRQLTVGSFADGLKDLALEVQAPCVAASQLNRGPEDRADKVPTLSDLRESGMIEQTADLVNLINRPDYYDRAHPRSGEADLIVAKHRNGPTDTITVAHQLWEARFRDMATL